MATSLLLISILFQFIAVFLAVRLIRITGRRTGWALIAAAISLITVRLMVTLFNFLSGEESPPSLLNEVIALATSALITVGIAAITPLYLSMKQSEEAIRRSHEKYRTLVDSIDGIVWEADARTFQFSYVSKQAERLLGYAVERWIAEPGFFKDHLHPDDREKVSAFFAFVVREKKSRDLECRMLADDDREIWLKNIVSVTVENDKAVRLQGVMINITEQKRIEESLRQSEERFRLVTRATNDVMSDWNMVTNTLWWNENLKTLFGYKDEEIEPGVESWINRIHPEDKERVLSVLNAVVNRREEFYSIEYRFRRADGSHAMVFDRSCLVYNQHGRPLRKVNAMMDITERKQAEEALRASRELLDNIMESSPSYIFAQDLQYRIILANGALARIFGMSKEEILGKTEQDVFPKNIADTIQAANKQIMETGTPLEIEEVIAGRDRGEPRVVMTIKFPLKDPHGEIRGLGGVATDITERKQAEEALKRSEERYRTLIQQATDGIFISDPSWNILDANPRGREMLGYTNDDTLRLNLRDIVAAEDLARLPEAIAHLQRGEEWVDEWTLLRKNGTTFPAEISGKALSDGRLLGIVRDITERKKAEKALRTSEERFQLAARATHDIIWDWDLAANTVWWNPNFYTLFGYKTEEIEPGIESWQNRIHPEERERVITGIQAAIDRGEQFWSDEYRFRRSDGSDATLLDRGYIVHDQGGKATRMIGAMMDITGRKRAEEALKEAEARLRLALQAGRIGTWDWNLTTGKIVWSSGHEELWGMPPGTFKGTYEEFEAHLHPEDRDEVKRATAQAIAEHSNFRHEYRVVWPDGSVHWIAGQGEPLFDKSGRPVRMIGVVRDITEPKRAESALRESEERLRLVTLATHDAVWDWNLATNTIWWNEAFSETFGYKNEEVKPGFEFWESLIHPEDREHLLSDLQATIDRGEQSLATEYRLRRGDGSYATVLDRGFVLRDQNAKPVRMVGAMMDITERKQAEEALRRSERHLRDVINSLIFFAGVLTPEGIFVEANQTALNATGLSLEEVIGKPFDQIYAWSYSPEAQAKLRDAIGRAARGETVRYDTPLRLKGDRFITIDFGMAPMFDAEGKVIYLVPSGVDITERKRAEEEITKLNIDLERRVAERTAQLQATNKELESFSYSVSHDLRAPLRAISGFSRVLLARYADRFDAQGKDFLQRVDAASRRMGELIEDLLNLSRITRSEMHQEPVDLSSLAKTIAEELQHSEPERKATFLIQDDLQTSADPRLLRIALENLLGNAWKFTLNRPSAMIEFGRNEQEGKQVYFVRDNGAGFDMAYADKLFTPFQRLHSLSEFPGTGIGLATVQRIIHRHGGKVWAEGEVEKGATFYFTL